MKHILFFSLSLLFLFLSCSDSEPTEPNSLTDALLKTKIIGTWERGDYQTITFEPGGNFTAIFDYNFLDTTIENAEIRKGTYDIINGILNYTSITEWSINLFNNYKPTRGLENKEGFVAQILPAYKIQFKDDLMYMFYLDILVRDDNNTAGLWGKWKSYQWALEDEYFTNNRTIRKLVWEYNFNKPRMEVIIGAKFLGDSSFTISKHTYELEYDPPEINMGDLGKRNVEFHSNKMWMLHKFNSNYKPFQRVK
jgi:hypothetical protein